MSAGGPRCGSGGPVVEPEADLHGDLEVTAPVVLDAAPHPGDLEPVQVVQGPRGAADGALDRVVDALGGGADNLTDRIHVVCHRWSFPAKPRGTGQVRPPERRREWSYPPPTPNTGSPHSPVAGATIRSTCARSPQRGSRRGQECAVEIMTSSGVARADLDGEGPAAAPRFLLVLTHGAGGSAASPDLLAVRDASLGLGGLVARVTQPYRVKGARAPGSAVRQD